MARAGPEATVFLKRGLDIERAKRCGRRIPTAQFNMVIASGGVVRTQFAVIVGRKFGPATRRNRAKRRLRELIRSVEARLVPHYHVLIFPKSPVVTGTFASLKQVWESLLLREGILRA